MATAVACEGNASVEMLDLDVISYEDFVTEDADALQVLKTALYEKGIVGIRGIPGYKEKVHQLIETAQAFSALPEEVKESYGSNPAVEIGFAGYDRGKREVPASRWAMGHRGYESLLLCVGSRRCLQQVA